MTELTSASNAGNVPNGADEDPRAPWNQPDPEYAIWNISEVDLEYGGGVIITVIDNNSDYKQDHHLEPDDLLQYLDYL